MIVRSHAVGSTNVANSGFLVHRGGFRRAIPVGIGPLTARRKYYNKQSWRPHRTQRQHVSRDSDDWSVASVMEPNCNTECQQCRELVVLIPVRTHLPLALLGRGHRLFANLSTIQRGRGTLRRRRMTLATASPLSRLSAFRQSGANASPMIV